MPVYDLICKKCGNVKEEFLKLEEKEPVCDKCGGVMIKTMSAPVFILKGSCWEKDGYSRQTK